ncbi:delta-like protein 1 [Durio zibethinus]|uniref:Delta-like protein 1 n=1 Tax=Durio zibethinus TaxID=66656 RepID=A0A6P6A3J1_DURZI|nr:delta-like protein 1 [Durio zibethinus]
MSNSKESMLIAVVAISLLFGSLNVHSLPCEDSRCKTGSCNRTGACICNLPDPSTILDGDRPFLGGEFCDTKMTMCDGTNSFWCENGGICEEIVQGEDYSCKCPPGYTGERCEHPGAPCGRIFCFHEAECLAQSDVCQCPPNWQGSVDCSLPTKNTTDSSMDSITSQLPHWRSSNSSTNWIVVVVAISFSIGAVAGGAIYAKKLFGKKETAPKFQQLSRMKSLGILDDDDEGDTMVPEMSRNGNQRL